MYELFEGIRRIAPTNAIDRAVVFSGGDTLLPHHFASEYQGEPVQPVADERLQLNSTSLPEIEEQVIRQVLEEKDWNLSQTATALGIARGTLYSKIKSHNIER